MLDEVLAKGKSTLQTVTQVRWWTDRLLTFTTTRPAEYSFVAGQYARLGLPDRNDVIWRAYSMTSAPGTDSLEFYGILVEGGRFTSLLKHIQPGSPLLIEKQPFGFMTPDRFTGGDDLWMLSTGTGVGPFIALLRDGEVWTRFKRLILVHCVRHKEELCYTEELEAMARQDAQAGRARLQLLRLVTRESTLAPPADLQGRITDLLRNGELERTAGVALSDEASRIMLCGNPDMIEDTRRLLHERGLRPVRRALPGHFLTENYW
ncbi:ferredoxin--NADP reductase [Noviherbaspirillum galbum]|uniref:ferredoxin--NADP(+) reductase n=1 Tax=Noviherbaspirillum galbum TaxID=2709383 RepID=A0A6B3SFQ9_9BURK|nr:ferredoxin--NADP reductase [Noviherbaspirillum galbum]NEX59694.1 ferredoxin--NADP reductase [Noviherbaspirillum galbum]